LVGGDGLDDGEYTVQIVVTDLLGLTSDPLDGKVFMVDKTAPGADTVTAGAITSGADFYTDENAGVMYFNAESLPLTISGSADVGAKVDLYIGDIVVATVTAEDGSWSFEWDGKVDGSALADGSYTASVVVTDLAGNVSDPLPASEGNMGFVIDTVPEYYSGSAAAGYESVIGTHIAKVKGTAVSVNPIDSLVGHVASSVFVDIVEDYSVNLPDGLTIEENGSITGEPTAAGQTWLAVHSFDLAGNESTTYVQLVVTTGTPYTASATATTVAVSGSSAKQYTANALDNTITVTASVGVVVFAGLGDDTINIGNSSTIENSEVPFARIDGGGGVDTLSFLFKGESIDLSEFNNPDGSGGVIEHVEKLKFAGSDGNESSIELSAADVFHLQSDATDANGRALVVLTADSSSNQFVTANLTDFTRVGTVNAFTDTGSTASGTSSNANYTKFYGSYTDHDVTHGVTVHDVTVLVQGYYVLG
jgi:hypothetical protein